MKGPLHGGPTIQDVARLAGTSAASVSNFLNGKTGRFGRDTSARIEGAIGQLRWRPNQAARQLKVGQARIIGLIVPSVDNPFHGAFARLAEEAAMRRGYHVVLCNSLRSVDRERHYAEALWGMGVRGVISSSSPLALDHLAALQDRGLHLVAVDRGLDPSAGLTFDAVSLDNRDAGRTATQYLQSLGHRRIGLVYGRAGSFNREERAAGWGEALGRFDPALVWRDEAGLEEEGPALGRRAAREMLQSPAPPTAFLAINDMHAIGVYAGIRDRGLDIPGDISVVSIDDIALAAVAFPPLTTIRQPLAAVTEAAVDSLVKRLDGDPSPPREVVFRGELVIRSSAAPLRAASRVPSEHPTNKRP